MLKEHQNGYILLQKYLFNTIELSFYYSCDDSLKERNLKELFPANTLNNIYRHNKNLEVIISSSLYPSSKITKSSSITSCSSCGICKNYMGFENAFTCTVTGKKYIKGDLNCNSCNTVYLVEYSYCKHQYVGSALNFKEQFRIHKSDIKTNKDRCATARHFSNICCDPTNRYCYLRAQLIEQVFGNSIDKEIEVIL